MTFPDFPSTSGFGEISPIFIIFFSIIVLGFLTLFGFAIYTFIKNAKRQKKNDNSPVLTTDATVVTKREDIIHRHHDSGMNNDMDYTTTSTEYFVTFQVPTGDRMELELQGDEYGLIAENDAGMLTFQGTRFLKFVRNHTPMI